MNRIPETKIVTASLNLEGCPEGQVLFPLKPRDEIYEKYFAGWDTPLTPLGGFNLDPGLAVVNEEGKSVLSFTGKRADRAIVYEKNSFRDCYVTAKVKPIDAEAQPHNDRNDCNEALVGIVFRVEHSRAYYQFGIEGKQKIVLYRRIDDEWLALAEQKAEITDSYFTLGVTTQGDGIHCNCKELGIEFFCTDTTIKYGKVGIRSLGRSNIMALEISQTPSQSLRDKPRSTIAINKENKLSEGVPDPVLVKKIDLVELGGSPVFKDFVEPERYDMLILGSKITKAMTTDGQILWESSIPIQNVEFSKVHGKNGRLIYGLTGSRKVKSGLDIRGVNQQINVSDEMIVMQGNDGKVLARRKIPELHETIRMPDYGQSSGNMTNTGGFDIVLREWREDKGGGGVNIWVYDKDLNPLWHYQLPGAWYGHHYSVQFFDVDGDGRDELLAGGTLLDSEGKVIWVHDRNDEVLKINGAQHYDAVALGNFTQDDAVDPVAFLLGGSSGVYVVDGLTGKTRSFHRVGHAQGRYVGKVRKDISGEQILVATRWGNMGILNLFSGYGDRLWT
ncbi:hypothetical protein FJZ33_04630, partial [Candidatus Poribacteria bacterium]|nr:hypothetical protein [Candidatus Poribacteria bacterium]